MQVTIIDKSIESKVLVKLTKKCKCGEDLSIPASLFKLTDFSSSTKVSTYKRGECMDCGWKKAHENGLDNFMDSKAEILNGKTESEYQKKYGVAWNE